MFSLPFVALAVFKLIVMEFLLAESHTTVRIDFVRDHLEGVEVFNMDKLI